MGQLTHAQLVTEAVELAGNTGLTTRAQTWLGLVLRHLSERFTFMQTGDNVKALFTGASGVGTFTVGSSTAGTADVFSATPVRGIQRILCATNSALDDWAELGLESIGRVSPGVLDDSVESGRPHMAFIEPRVGQQGYTVTLAPKPDKAYRFMVIVDALQSSVYQYSEAQVNAYPSDMTVVQGVYAMCLKHQQDEREGAAWGLFEKMAGDDRVRYGNMNTGQKLRLNPKTFRPAGAGGKPWDWMGPK